MDRLGELLADLDNIAREGFGTYRRIPTEFLLEHGPRARANCIHDHMMAAADRRFMGRHSLRLIDAQGLKVWGVDDHTVIRFKKMNDEGRSRNYQTKQAKAFDRGEQIDGLFPEAVRLTVGYVPDASATSVLRVQISRMQGKRVAWCAAIIPEMERIAGASMWYDVTRQKDALDG